MRSFEHVSASSIEEACALLAERGDRARLNAGGTDLLGALKDAIYPTSPELIVDLKTIPGLDSIEADDSGLRIGALARLADISASDLVRQRWPIVAEAAHAVASPQIRNMGTLGGNLCQEVRCWYFRYPAHLGGAVDCLRKGGPRCPAVRGDTRYHAIVGGKGCFAVCPSDMAVALAALDAEVVIAGSGGRRRQVPVAGLYEPTRLTLEPGEMVVEVRVPAPKSETRSVFAKHAIREAVDFALVSAAVSITLDDGICTDARVVLGAVAPAPYRAVDAEALLRGRVVDEDAAAQAGEAAVASAKPLRGNAYKVEVARALARRTIAAALADD
jgi:xanthine dehydrogenase YagS FAD-binding subunit